METTSELAARWAVRANARPLSSEEERELEAWLAADPRHRGAYVRARAQWVNLDRLAALCGPQTPAIESTVPVPWHLADTLSRRHLLAASVSLITVATGGLSLLAWRRVRERFTTGIGEVRRIPLPDGSTMVLNTDTEVAAHLTRRQRDIQLIRGEALFEVAHDKARPFIVRAKGTAVRAVGTAFSVRLEASQIDLTVTEGVVEVSEQARALGSGPMASTAAPPGAQRVKANEHMVIASARAPDIEPIATPEINRRLAWRQGMVSFDGESLAMAASEINRHNQRQVVIDDPKLARRPVVGRFRATDIDGFCAAAAAALNVRAVVDGNVIRLEPLASPLEN